MSVLLRSKTQIFGLTAELAQIVNDAAAESAARAQGDTELDTRLTTELTDINAAIATLDAAALKKSDNLSDVTDVAAARANLSVDSSAEVDAKITAAQLALGTNHVVADIAERDALVNLDVADTVFVTDGGNGNWIIYRPAAVDANGTGTAWVVLSDEGTYLNANSAAFIKASYESNEDTNAFTDAEQAKVSLLSVTNAIDLDNVVQKDQLLTSPLLSDATDTDVASALAVKSYVDTAVATVGVSFAAQSLVVTSDKIVLANKPKDGLILNFGTVRHVDANGVAYDIPVMVDGTDASGKTYTLLPDSVGQFNTKNVQVQYPYVTV